MLISCSLWPPCISADLPPPFWASAPVSDFLPVLPPVEGVLLFRRQTNHLGLRRIGQDQRTPPAEDGLRPGFDRLGLTTCNALVRLQVPGRPGQRPAPDGGGQARERGHLLTHGAWPGGLAPRRTCGGGFAPKGRQRTWRRPGARWCGCPASQLGQPGGPPAGSRRCHSAGMAAADP